MLIHYNLPPAYICQIRLLLALSISCSKMVFGANKHSHGTDVVSANNPIHILLPLPYDKYGQDDIGNPFGITMLKARPVLDEVRRLPLNSLSRVLHIIYI
jgi:hypothetical protein